MAAKTNFIILPLLLLSPTIVLAQKYIFKTYTVEDGLVANPVRHIFQDKKGFMWIATWEGLSKYDGNKFTNYTIANGLSHNLVNDVFESGDAKLYVAENNGDVDIVEGSAVATKAAFRNLVINQFCITRNHRVIAATDTNGVCEIKNGYLLKPAQAFPQSTYNTVTEVTDSVFIGGCNGSICVLDRDLKLIAQVHEPGVLTFKIFKDSQNRLWTGTNKGLKLLSSISSNSQQFHFSELPAPLNIPALKDHNVNDIIEDVNKNLWIATANGLVKIYPGGNWQLFTEKDGLPSADIACVYQDKEENIWIGTLLGLAKLVTKNDIRIFSLENNFSSKGENVLTSLENDLYATGSNSSVPINSLLLYSRLHNLFYKGRVQNTRPALFYSNNNGLGKYDPTNGRIIDSIPPAQGSVEVYCSVSDGEGVIFNGTHNGLFVRTEKKSYYDKKISKRISSLLIDDQNFLWIGTWSDGVYRARYTRSNDNIDLSIEDVSNLLPDKNIRCLFQDSKGSIWIGTRYDGAFQLKKSNQQFTVKQFDLRAGLMSNRVLAISEDKKGSIWIGSDLGLDKILLTGSSLRVFNFSRVNNFFAATNTILTGSDGSVWLFTDKAIVKINDDEMETSPATAVYITSVALGDTSFQYKKYRPGSKVHLKYFQSQAKFEFSSPAFINERQVLYSYRLIGSADTSWSEPSNLHNASFASLQPGDYDFQVRALGWNGQWGASSNFLFAIRPPFWQTWWFYMLVGIFIGCLFYGFYRYRIGQLMNLQKMRNRIATDLHDDIGATLTNINMLSEISRKNLQRPKEAERFLHRITEEVTSSSQALNDIIWSVNSQNDSMENILLRMRRYAAELFDNSKTSFHLELDENVTGKKINMEQRRDLYLIYKESMNNIFKHANANNIWINVGSENNRLHLKIKDDGQGFDSSAISHRNGLRNIHFRTEKWKGTSSIVSNPGRGTVIEITLPVSR